MSIVASHRDVTAATGSDVDSTTYRRGTPTVLPKLVDIETVAQSLGVGVRHVRRLVDGRRIPFVKVGRYVRFDVDEVMDWVEVHRIETVDCRSRGHSRQ